MTIRQNSFIPTCPTRNPDCARGVFKSIINFGSKNPAPVDAWLAKVDGPHEGDIWITRTAGINTYHHRAAEVLELSREGWETPEPGTTDSNLGGFWPIISNEFMGRAFCGELSAARELMQAIESLWARDPELSNELIASCDDNPLHVYLFEFEKDGLAAVHFSYNYEWDEPKACMEAALREAAPDQFEKLPYIFNSEDYFGTYDFYCSESFLSQTSEEMTLAAWRHCTNKPGLRECIDGHAGFSATIDAMEARAEARDISAATPEASHACAAPPRI